MPVGRNRIYTGTHVIVEFELNRSGIRAIANGPELVRSLESIVANVARPIAEGYAARDIETGDYERSFRVENTHDTLPRTGPWPMRRAACRLVNISDHAIYVEIGSKHNEAHHVLRRTLEFMASIGTVHLRGH